MKVASSCSDEDVMVRLCFFVIVRNAKGRSMAGGSRIGSTAGVVGFLNAGGGGRIASLAGREAIGYAGVANAGDDDGMASCAVFAVLNRGAGARGVSIESRSSMLRIESVCQCMALNRRTIFGLQSMQSLYCDQAAFLNPFTL